MSKYKIEIKWGLIFTIATILWMGIERLFGLHGDNIAKHSTFSNVFAIIAIAIFVFALLDKRKSFYNGKMTWKQGFIAGVILSVVAAVLSPISQWVTFNFLSTDFFTNIIAHTVEQGKYSLEAAEKIYNMNSFLVQGVIGSLVMGVVTSAVVAFFVKKK